MGIDYASTDAPFGFKPYGTVISANMYCIATSPAAAVFHQDLVEISGTGLATPKMGVLQSVYPEATGAAGSILGSILALFDSDMNPTTSIAASATGDGTIAGYCLVADNPLQKYIAQEDGDTSSLQIADMGLNSEAIITTAGDTDTGISGMEIDSSEKATTGTLALKLHQPHPDDTISSDGSAGTNCRFIVSINSAWNAPNVVGV